MLWMQGESDAKKQADAEAYQKKLEQFIALMRKETGKTDLPVVIGRLSTRVLESPKFKFSFAKIVQRVARPTRFQYPAPGKPSATMEKSKPPGSFAWESWRWLCQPTTMGQLRLPLRTHA